jgi:hypothetical protein
MRGRGCRFSPGRGLLLPALGLVVAFMAVPAAAQNSPHGKIAFACEECHSADSWTVMPQPSRFDHQRTGFALTGQHAQVECTDCHTSLTFKFKKSAKRCADCHTDVHRGELGTTCDRCHAPRSWLVPDMVRRHSSTRFPLVGAHASVPCQECHTSQQKNEYVGLRTDCYGCHAQDFAGTQSPNHRQAGFSTDCTGCHAVNATHWGTPFDHAKTGFALLGAHATVTCVQCHAGNVFRAMATQCIACHTTDFTTAKAPPHTGFVQDCMTCHTMKAWQPASFDHNKSAFPLTGAHAAVACQQCHANNVFTGLPTACSSCHQQDFASAKAPPHAGFSTVCTTCHTTSAWAPATFNHGNTPFPLTGGHLAVTCVQCHANNVYAGLTTDCYTCHKNDFAAATTPVAHAGFATSCVTCHTTSPAWKPSTFNHATSRFPLTGAHQAVACLQCHANNVYASLTTACVGCHQQDFATANAPPHTGFSTNCTTCHTTSAWAPATFNHSNTPFPLTGGHLAVTCIQCHVNNVYAGLTTDCYACHKTDFAAAVSPVAHVGFATTCATCHTTNPGWKPSTFNHATSRFPLTGAHQAVACLQCHANNVYASLTTACVGCHQQDFTAANAPPHTGFPTDCSTCHTTSAWQPATFNHANTPFPLTGGHLAVACAQCHVNNVYVGLTTDCYTCHKTDFAGATAPVAHTGFPTTCVTCHTTNPGWKPSTFNHNTSAFPLTGAHLAVACLQCHVNNKYVGLPVTCYGCHQQDFTTAAAPPHAGFPTDCTTCHTTSAWQPATFNHATTPFPLTGAHVTVACAQCHANNVYVGLTTDCYTCHKTDFTGAVSPVPHTGFPTACVSCHTTNPGWTPSTYSHSAARPRFPQDNRHLNAGCVKCHTTSTNYTLYCCQSSGCHNSCQGG